MDNIYVLIPLAIAILSIIAFVVKRVIWATIILVVGAMLYYFVSNNGAEAIQKFFN